MGVLGTRFDPLRGADPAVQGAVKSAAPVAFKALIAFKLNQRAMSGS